MKVYNFDTVENIYIVGVQNHDFQLCVNGMNFVKKDADSPDDGHGLFGESRYEICKDPFDCVDGFNEDVFENSLFIFNGDCGIGMNGQSIDDPIFDECNEKMRKNSSYAVFVRGEYDDASLFDGVKINKSNLKAIPDYSVLIANGKKILCVGGAVSVDRTWKKKNEELINKFSNIHRKVYCEKEAPVFKKRTLETILNEHKIDYVVSHSVPHIVTKHLHLRYTTKWFEQDNTVSEDIELERDVMDEILNAISNKGYLPEYWAFTHYGNMSVRKYEKVIYQGIGCHNFISNIDDSLREMRDKEVLENFSNPIRSTFSPTFSSSWWTSITLDTSTGNFYTSDYDGDVISGSAVASDDEGNYTITNT